VSVFARFRRWFQGPATDRDTQRKAEAVKEKRDQARLSQSDTPGPWPAGTVTSDQGPKSE